MNTTTNNPARQFSKETNGVHVLAVAWKYPGLARRVTSPNLIAFLSTGPIRDLVELVLSGRPTDPTGLPSEHRRLVEVAMTSPFLVSPEMALSYILTMNFYCQMQVSPVQLTRSLSRERDGRLVWEHVRGSLQILGLFDEVRDTAIVIDRVLELQASEGLGG